MSLTAIEAAAAANAASPLPSFIQYAVGSRSTNPSVTTMSGLTNGNLLVLTGSMSSSAGWDNLNLASQGLTQRNSFTAANHPAVFVATRVIDGTEAASYSVTESNTSMLALMEISGTFDVCGATDRHATNLTFDISGITVTNNNSLLLTLGGVSNTDTLGMPSGATALFNDSGTNPGLGVSYESVNSGATGTRQISRSNTTGGIGGVMFAVY